MIALPSPIPHPLDFQPFDRPHWAGEALESVVGLDWPQGNEVTTWDVADRWHALATALTEPHDAAFAAAAQIMSGYGGSGITADGFLEAWQRLSGDENAPLNALLQIAHELGALVEECGTDIEAAKLEAWIEISVFLTELIGFEVTVALTLGAVAPAAEGLILSTRVAIQQIFTRLIDQLGTRSPKKPAEPATTGREEDRQAGYASQARRIHRRRRQNEYAEHLEAIAESTRAKILDLTRRADAAFRAGSTLLGEEHHKRAVELHAIVAEIESQVADVRAGGSVPATVDVDPQLWARTSSDATPGGLRAPLGVHQKNLENAMPRDGDGRAQRLADPRAGEWFRLANGGGPQADPTRGLNCLDGVLALFDTYRHGRPRVSAPRTLDAYAHGDPNRPVGGEEDGVKRIQAVTGSAFQNLCPFVGGADPAEARPAVDAAIRNLANHLHNCGHGAYAFIITDLDGGGCHSWAAVNQSGTILFLDPQVGLVAEEPLYRHNGRPAEGNVVSIDALVMNGQGEPAPLPYHGPGQWAVPTDVDDQDEDEANSAWLEDRHRFESLAPEQRAVLEASIAQSGEVAARMSAHLHDLIRSDGIVADLVDEQYRVKSVESLGRKYLEVFEAAGDSAEKFLRDVKDRVRFSVRIPENRYSATLGRLLYEMSRLDYATTGIADRWGDDGRPNGVNTWLTDPDGFQVEVQFIPSEGQKES